MANPIFSLNGKRIWVAGHNGMVGSAITRQLKLENCDVITIDRSDLDLTKQTAVQSWMSDQKIDAVFLAAAKVGGILANDRQPAAFLYENLMIESNIINSSYQTNVKKLLFLGSSCIYPRLSPQPIAETSLLEGALEPTNEWYAIAKIAGIKLCQAYRKQYGCDFISSQPTNLYGPGDFYDAQRSHVIPALIEKAHKAKQAKDTEIVVWGTGSPLREFLYVDDLAGALVFIMKHYSDYQPLNVGTGEEISIGELAELVCQVVGYNGTLSFDLDKPDGTPRKLLDSQRLNSLGWSASTKLRDGLEKAYGAYLNGNSRHKE
jgi:GDP-L-fucose synthase